jgi:hypothetical protein
MKQALEGCKHSKELSGVADLEIEPQKSQFTSKHRVGVSREYL